MQSFSYKAKAELCRGTVQRLCCARAECYGALLYCNTFTMQEVRIITENPEFAARLPRLFQRAFNVKFDRLPSDDLPGGKLIFQITEPEKLRRILDTLGYDPRQSLVLHVNFALQEDDCCRTAFLRGAFLAGGSVTDPEKRYHLELSTSHVQASREVSALSSFLMASCWAATASSVLLTLAMSQFMARLAPLRISLSTLAVMISVAATGAPSVVSRSSICSDCLK